MDSSGTWPLYITESLRHDIGRWRGGEIRDRPASHLWIFTYQKEVVDDLCSEVRAGSGNYTLDTSWALPHCSIGNWKPGALRFVCIWSASSDVKLPPSNLPLLTIKPPQWSPLFSCQSLVKLLLLLFPPPFSLLSSHFHPSLYC